jgi:hypothetical protein
MTSTKHAPIVQKLNTKEEIGKIKAELLQFVALEGLYKQTFLLMLDLLETASRVDAIESMCIEQAFDDASDNKKHHKTF